MAVTISRPSLRDALRLESDQDTTDEIDRILRYAATAVLRQVATAPDVVHNEAVVRLASYLFDQPSTSRGAAYAGALRNSGAAAILAPYRRRRGGNVSGVDSEGVGVGIDAAGARALIADALDELDIPQLIADGIAAGGAPPVTVQRLITNAELKTIDTDYIEIAPAPGFDKYIQIREVYLTKYGNDPPPSHVEYYRIAVSPNPVITVAEALAGAGRGDLNDDIPIPAWDTPQYFYAGTSDTNQDVTSVDGLQSGDFATQFERVPGTIEVDGLAIKWWRTVATYDTRAALFGARVGTRVRRDFAAPELARIGNSNYLALLYSDADVADRPYGRGDYSGDAFWQWLALLNLADGTMQAEAIGGQNLFEDSPLLFGSVVSGPRNSYYSADTFDTYLAPINDVELSIRVRYQIHDVA